MVNHMTLQGRLTRDPELKTTQSGVSVCSVTVAWSERRGENENKLFMPVTAWRGTAEMLAKYFAKGREIIVEGCVKQREWTDNDGNKRQVIEMQADRVHFCGPKQDAEKPQYEKPQYEKPDAQQNFEELPDSDGDLPF